MNWAKFKDPVTTDVSCSQDPGLLHRGFRFEIKINLNGHLIFDP